MNRPLIVAGALMVALPAGFATGRMTAATRYAPDPRRGSGGTATPTEAALAAVTGEARDHRSPGDAADQDLLARSTVEAGPALVARRRREEANVAAAWPGGPTRWWVAPLATRTRSLTSDAAEVDVWFAEVIAPPGLKPMGDWRVTTVRLRRQSGQWRVADLADRFAPVLRTRPSPQASPEDLSAFLDGFEVPDHG